MKETGNKVKRNNSLDIIKKSFKNIFKTINYKKGYFIKSKLKKKSKKYKKTIFREESTIDIKVRKYINFYNY